MKATARAAAMKAKRATEVTAELPTLVEELEERIRDIEDQRRKLDEIVRSIGGLTRRARTRPAILEATRVLALSDSDIARLMGVSPMTVSEWGSGRKPIPLLRHLAMIVFVKVLTFYGDEDYQGQEAQRARIICEAVDGWVKLAYGELGDRGWVHNPMTPEEVELIEQVEAMARQMIGRIKTLDAAAA